MIEKPANIEVDGPKITEFVDLTKEEQAHIENEIVAFITNPLIKYIKNGDVEDRPVLELNSEDLNSEKDYQWMQINSHGNRNIIFREPAKEEPYQMIAFDRLPRNIELLLGVVHREFFEEYKKIISKRE